MKIEIVGFELTDRFRSAGGRVVTTSDLRSDPDFDSTLDDAIEDATRGLSGPCRIVARFGGVELVWNVSSGGADLPPDVRPAPEGYEIFPYLAGETFADAICALLASRPEDYDD